MALKPSIELVEHYRGHQIRVWVWSGYMTFVIDYIQGFMVRNCTVQGCVRLAKAKVNNIKKLEQSE